MPAAGTFPGWPERAAEVTVMDPCCGSGHFLVAAFEMLRRMRMEEDGLDEVAAADAVLRDNLYGLELDPRCTQIAAFALALAAWKAGGYRELPLPNIACSGIGVGGRVEEWTRLAGDDVRLKTTLERLYYLFRDAPTLGSLINPADVPLNERMWSADYAEVEPLLHKALTRARTQDDPTAEVFGAAAEGIARAARLLAGTYTLAATNVPYLFRSKQDDALIRFCDAHHSEGKADLATAFIERCRALAQVGGSYALVTPQNWLFLNRYMNLRYRMLREQTWNHFSRLGAGAFETISGEVVNVVLVILTNRCPEDGQMITGIDASILRTATGKAKLLHELPLQAAVQLAQIHNPEARISIDARMGGLLLEIYAASLQGISPADLPRFGRCFWEIVPGNEWQLWQGSPDVTTEYGGRSKVLRWGSNLFEAVEAGKAYIRGQAGWDKLGIAVAQMGELPSTLYTGEKADTNVAVIIPKDSTHRAAIWAFCSSPNFKKAVRQFNQKLNVDVGYLTGVPFDLEHWQAVADAAGPLPEPYSNDPTQWLFEGHPVGSTEPLQVAVARLLGYRWRQQKTDDLDALADTDGILPLPAVAGEQPGAERLRAFLAAAYKEEWSPAQAERLLAAVGYAGKGLDAWLRDGFFEQHCRLFHNRPFIWHVWDGRKDGFAALVSYHLLDRAHLDRLIYTYLGAWIAVQQAARNAEEPGAEARLVAALNLRKRLEAVRDGEAAPDRQSGYDIYVRWKPLEKQPLGWEPDLNDGVRLNIRPFVTAGVLRSKFTIHWKKDRGTNPDGSERLNDLHYTLAEKRQARA